MKDKKRRKCVEVWIGRGFTSRKKRQIWTDKTIQPLNADKEDSSSVMNTIHLCMAINHKDFICWNIYIFLTNMPHIMLLTLME